MRHLLTSESRCGRGTGLDVGGLYACQGHRPPPKELYRGDDRAF